MFSHTRPIFRSILLATVLALGAAPAARAQDAAIPDTPAGQRLASILALLQRSDTASIHAFVEGEMNAEFRAVPMEAHLDAIVGARTELRGARLSDIDSPHPLELAATLLADGRPFLIRVGVEDAPPHRIAGLSMGAAPAPVQPAPEVLTVAQIREIVDSAAARMEARYVIPDTGLAIARHLRARRDTGAYDALTRPAALSEALTTDLRAINGDRHLYMVVNTAPSGGSGGGGSAEEESDGIAAVERLEGNVGYLRLTILAGSPRARDNMLSAIRLLEPTDAVILDLRGVPGGSDQMANFIISHFTAPGLPSLRVTSRDGGQVTERATLAEVPGPRRLGVPLYVLTDRGSGSAAEDVPFVLQNLGRATIVGERTMGAGRNNETFPLAHGMGVSISVTLVADPRTGREWEGVGVVPQVRTTSEDALTVAHGHALRTLGAQGDERRRAVLERTAEFVAARAAATPASAREQAAFVGRYEGERVITARDGRLFYQPRAESQPRPMVRLGDGRYAVGPTQHVVFTGQGAGLKMEVGAPGQPPRVFARVR